MIEISLVGSHVSAFAQVLGAPFAVPPRAPEGDPDYGGNRYVDYPARGLAIVIDEEDRCSAVQFFGAGKDPDYTEYGGPLLADLSFDSSRVEVRRAMGAPVQSNDASRPSFVIPLLPWDWFAQNGLKLHFEYSAGADRIMLISAMPLPAD